MSKSRSGLDKKQTTIFELLRSLHPELPTEGRCRVVDGLRSALRDAIKASPLSRHQIAGEMSHLVGTTITKEMIDSWTREDQSDGSGGSDGSDGKTIRRHVPAEYLAAFCSVTHSMEPLRLIAEAAGFFVFPGTDAMRAEMQRMSEQVKQLQREIGKRRVFLKEMEKGK